MISEHNLLARLDLYMESGFLQKGVLNLITRSGAPNIRIGGGAKRYRESGAKSWIQKSEALSRDGRDRWTIIVKEDVSYHELPYHVWYELIILAANEILETPRITHFTESVQMEKIKCLAKQFALECGMPHIGLNIHQSRKPTWVTIEWICAFLVRRPFTRREFFHLVSHTWIARMHGIGNHSLRFSRRDVRNLKQRKIYRIYLKWGLSREAQNLWFWYELLILYVLRGIEEETSYTDKNGMSFPERFSGYAALCHLESIRIMAEPPAILVLYARRIMKQKLLGERSILQCPHIAQ